MLVSDLETRVRTYLNEASASFYTQAEIWRWLDIAGKDISQNAQCIRRILTAATGGANVRNVATNSYKPKYVEYIGTRTSFLPKIDPLKIGHYPLKGTAPQFWYPSGTYVGIEPLPDAIYNLRLYVIDIAKLVTTTVMNVDWTAAARWTLGATAVHAGATSNLPYTAGISDATNYSFEFEITGVGTAASLVITAGTQQGSAITTNGWHTQTIISNGTTLTLTGVNDITVNSFKIYKEANISAGTEELEFDKEWDGTLALYATYSGLMKDRNYGPAALLLNMYSGDFDYIRQNIIEVIPDGRSDLRYE